MSIRKRGCCTLYTVEPLYYGLFGTLVLVLIIEVSSIQRSLNTLQYYTGTQNGVLIIEVSAIQRFVIERFHCSMYTFARDRRVKPEVLYERIRFLCFLPKGNVDDMFPSQRKCRRHVSFPKEM